MPTSAFVVDASVVVRWLVDGPFSAECRTFLQHCGARDARLLAPSCLYSEVANALYRLCLARPPVPVLAQDEAVDFLQSLPDYGIALVDYVRRLPSGDIALVPQWEQLTDGAVRDYRIAIYAQGLVWSYPRRRGSLFECPTRPSRNKQGRRCGRLTSASITAHALRALRTLCIPVATRCRDSSMTAISGFSRIRPIAMPVLRHAQLDVLIT